MQILDYSNFKSCNAKLSYLYAFLIIIFMDNIYLLYGVPSEEISTSSPQLEPAFQTIYKYKISKNIKNQALNLTLNNTVLKNTHTMWYRSTISKLAENGALNRSMYVLAGMTTVVLLYFLIKAIRIRTAKGRVKKYGILQGGEIDYDDEDYDSTWGGSRDPWVMNNTKSPNIYSDYKIRKSGGSLPNKFTSPTRVAAHQVIAKLKGTATSSAKKSTDNLKRADYTLIKTNKSWEMTPLDKFDPDMPSFSDEDHFETDAHTIKTNTRNDDLDLFRATPPHKSAKLSKTTFKISAPVNTKTKLSNGTALPIKIDKDPNGQTEHNAIVNQVATPANYKSTTTTSLNLH